MATNCPIMVDKAYWLTARWWLKMHTSSMTKVFTRARRAINTMTRTRERCKLKCSVSDTFQLFRVKPLLFFAKLAACCKSFPSAATLLLLPRCRRRRHAAVLSVVSRLRPLKTTKKKPGNACFLGPTCHRFPIDMEQPLDECFANFFVGRISGTSILLE